MQQLAGLFPGSYYNNDESKALDFMGYFAHQRQQDEAFKNQEINRQSALEDLYQSQELRPLKADFQRLTNDTLEAQLGGHRARSGEAELQLSTDTQLQPHIIKAKMAEVFAGLSESERKREVSDIYRGLINRNISSEERKILEMLRDNIPENYKLNRGIEGKKEVAAVPKPGRTSGTGGAKAPAPPKAPKDDIQLASYWQFQADQENDPATKAELQALADGARSRALALIQAKADAAATGKVDLGAIGGVPTRPGIVPPTGQPPAAPKPAAPKTPVATVRMRDKSGKVYNVPAGRKQEALNDGLTIAE